MDAKQIEDVMFAAVGNPDSGILREVIPVLALAVDSVLNPKTELVQRVVKPAETR